MKQFKFQPRFKDTDALGHINNASYATWFEEARRPIFEIFIPDMDPKKWNLIIARVEIDYLAQGHYQTETTINTMVEKIGNSSFTIIQEAYQDGKIISRGKSFLVHFDYGTQKSVPMTAEQRTKLESI
jgi:acyl-CoA thioester hydrolase